MNDVYVSGVLCALGSIAGLYALIYQLKVLCRNTRTPPLYAIPILIGTLAWATASYEFFSVAPELDSNILIQRCLMVISWSWIAIVLSVKFKPGSN